MDLKVINTLWLCGRNAIGIVAYENEIGEIEFAIGTVPGFDEESDSQHITDWGTKVTKTMLDRFFDENSK